MVRSKSKLTDKQLYFLENYFIKIIMYSLAIVVLILKILTFMKFGNTSLYINHIDYFISVKLTDAFINRDSTLITLAAVFIGIYFTAFTLLATVSAKSAFSLLEKKHFNALLKYIRNAFFVSFSYLFISLLSPFISNLGWIYSSFCFLLLSYMLLSALRFGLLIYLILDKDIDRYINKVKEEKMEEVRINRTIIELEKFLNKQSNARAFDKSEEISKLLEDRKMKNNKKN